MKSRKGLLARASMAGAVWFGAAATAVAALPVQAVAADQPAQDTAAATELPEVVVTAQRRVENLQTVPISAQVVGRAEQVQKNLNTLPEVAQTVPSVHVGTNGRSSELYIRGIGSGINQMFDQSVGMFVDDIYHGRSRTTTATFLDLDRVEILKGPQSTFFGNNAIAGALNIVTTQPGDSFSAWARGLYGSHGAYAVEGAVGGPVSDKFDARVAATLNGGDGWIDDVGQGRKVPKEDNIGGRISLKFKPTEDLDATLKVEASDNKNTGALPFQLVSCPPPAPFTARGFCSAVLAGGYATGLDNNESSRSPGQMIRLKTQEDVLTVNYRMAGATLTSVTGYSWYDFNMNLDPDAIPAVQITNQTPEHYRQFSQEVRLTSTTEGPFEYLLGAYFQTDKLFVRQDAGYFFLTPVISGLPGAGPLVPYLPLGQRIEANQDEDSYALFASLSWNATDRLKLTGGLRASWVKKSTTRTVSYGTATQDYGGIAPFPAGIDAIAQTAANALGLGVAGTLDGSRTDDALMPSAKAQYQLTPQAMVYVSYARGFKAGGFNGVDTTGVADTFAYLPEHVNAYEAGLKSEWFDRRLLVNLAAFRSDYSNLQVAILKPNGANFLNIVQNAADSVSQGFEAEAQLIVTPELRISANGTYLDAHYTDYAAAGPTALQQLMGLKFQDLSGRPTAYAPSWSGNVSATYGHDLGSVLRFEAQIDAYFSSSYFLTVQDDPLLKQKGYTRIDGRLTLATQTGRWAVDLIGKNLTNARIADFGVAAPSSLGSVFQQKEEPINFAAQIRYRW